MSALHCTCSVLGTTAKQWSHHQAGPAHPSQTRPTHLAYATLAERCPNMAQLAQYSCYTTAVGRAGMQRPLQWCNSAWDRSCTTSHSPKSPSSPVLLALSGPPRVPAESLRNPSVVPFWARGIRRPAAQPARPGLLSSPRASSLSLPSLDDPRPAWVLPRVAQIRRFILHSTKACLWVVLPAW